MAHSIAIRNENVRKFFCQSPGRTLEKLTPAEWFTSMVRSWFGNNYSSKEMKLGTKNEMFILKTIQQRECVEAIFDVGLLQIPESPIGVSPDGVLVLDLPQNLEVNRETDGTVYSGCEMKTKIADRLVDVFQELKMEVKQKENAIIDFGPGEPHYILPVKVGSEDFYKYVPKEYYGQLMQLMLVLGVTSSLFVVASTSEIFFSCLVITNAEQLTHFRRAIEDVAFGLLGRFHDPRTRHAPDWTALSKLVLASDLHIAKSHYALWSGFVSFVEKNGIFVKGVYQFKTAVQRLYNVLKQGLDGSSHYISMINASNDGKCTWEQKTASHGIDQVLVNSYIGVRIFLAYRHLLQHKKDFKSLEEFRAVQNYVSPIFTEFTFRLGLHLSKEAQRESSRSKMPTSGFEPDQKVLLKLEEQTKALTKLGPNISRKRQQEFFKSKSGEKLRLSGTHSTRRLEKRKRCIVCGAKCQFACKLCFVTIHDRQTKSNSSSRKTSCFYKFHNSLRVEYAQKPFVKPKQQKENVQDNNQGDGEQDSARK